MDVLRSLYERSKGGGSYVNYDSVLEKFRCTSYEVPDPYAIQSKLLSCSFARKPKHGHILAASCENGEVIILNTRLLHPKRPDYYQISEAHNNALFSTAWSEVDMKMVTTSGDHTVSLWDVNDDGKLAAISSFKAHRRSVKTACFKPQSSDVFATGGRDGNIYVWDARSRKDLPEQYILNCHPKLSKDKRRKRRKEENMEPTVTWLTFQDEIKLISCADTDTNINVWDLRKTYLKTMEKPKPFCQLPSPKKDSSKGYSHMVLNRNGTKLYASSFNHVVYCFNIAGYSPVPDCTYSGHSVSSFYDKMNLSPDGRYLASVDNSNSNVCIWRTSLPGDPLVKLGGRLEGLSDVSWCPEDELMIATSSDHPFPWIWTVPPLDDVEQSKYEKEISQPELLSQPVGDSDTYCGPLSFAKRLERKKIKTSKLTSVTTTSFKLPNEPFAELPSLLKLPNSVVDGNQVHVCAEIGKHRDTATNWLLSMHNEKVKKLETPKQTKKGVKRKKPTSMSPGNDLIKYFKKSNENFDSINVT